MPKNNIAVVSANLGGFDNATNHLPQSIQHDRFMFTDENFPPRHNSMTPRLQAKIPKCFAWQMAPGYEYYFWIDGNLTMTSPDTLKYFYDNLLDHDIVVIQHPRRTSAHSEGRYLLRGLKQNSRYLLGRYENEWIRQEMAEIESDKDFVDDMLVNGGIFMYKNKPEVQRMLKEWWYYISRYLIMDQCSFSYVLKKSGLKIKLDPMNYHLSPLVQHRGHIHHH